MKKAIGCLALLVLLLAGASCLAWLLEWYLKNQQTQATVSPMDRGPWPDRTPRKLLHKTFPVKTYVSFEVEVPANSINPTVQGSFQVSAMVSGDVEQQSADVQLLLLNAKEFTDFAHGNIQGTALYASDPTDSLTVSWILHPKLDQTRKYYLVFRNLPAGSQTKTVKADFKLTFD